MQARQHTAVHGMTHLMCLCAEPLVHVHRQRVQLPKQQDVRHVNKGSATLNQKILTL
jgi:hypothetical protein